MRSNETQTNNFIFTSIIIERIYDMMIRIIFNFPLSFIASRSRNRLIFQFYYSKQRIINKRIINSNGPFFSLIISRNKNISSCIDDKIFKSF